MDEKNNKKKSQLIFITVIAIIALLLVGVIYQFVCIKKMERQIDDLQSQLSISSTSSEGNKTICFKTFDKKYE